MSDPHRKEYLRRIHRAQDFIERHLSEPLKLEAIARAAHFSAYHFHRVWTAVVGETLYQFILRLRLEKAAGQLQQNPDKPITAIALDCGFSCSATFARAFRSAFGISASEWRKNRKALGKDGKAELSATGYPGSVGANQAPPRSLAMSIAASQVKVEDCPKLTVAYVRHVGPYAGDPELFGRLFSRLMAWGGPRGLLGPDTQTLTIYHDNPDVTEPEKLRISCSVTVPPGTKPEGEVGIMEVAGGRYAKARFEILAQDYGGAWEWFMSEWMPSSGYQPDDGLCYELYLNCPENDPAAKHRFDIVMPVRPL